MAGIIGIRLRMEYPKIYRKVGWPLGTGDDTKSEICLQSVAILQVEDSNQKFKQPIVESALLKALEFIVQQRGEHLF